MRRAFFRQFTLGVMGVLAAACADAPLGTDGAPMRPPVEGAMVTAHLRGDVDVARGTLTWTVLDAPLASRTAQSPMFARYGTQNVTVRLYNTPVAATGCTPICIDTGRVGIRNMLAASIGDEQAGDAAIVPDTMGIYVYVTAGPTRTGGTGADPVLINQHGTMNFDAVDQKYFWYRSRLLGEVGGALRADGRDTTQFVTATAPMSRHVWKFSRENTVTNYSMTVMVQAPIDTETVGWAIDYPGDSLPDLRAEPRWRADRSTPGATWIITENAGPPTTLGIQANEEDTNREYIREDSVSSGDSAYIEVVMRQVTSNANKRKIEPIGYFGINDGTRLLMAGTDGTRVGFVSSNYITFLGTPFNVTTTTEQTYRLVKKGTAAVELWVNGTLRTTLAYTSFSADPDATRLSYFFFGHRSNSVPGGQGVPGTTFTSFWNNVFYKIGRTN